MSATIEPPQSSSSTDNRPAVDRLDGHHLTQDTFQSYLTAGRPVVITGLLNQRWTLDTLAEQLAGHSFPILSSGNTDKGIGSGAHSHHMDFSAYVAQLTTEDPDKTIYLGKCSLADTPLADISEWLTAEARMGLKTPAAPLNLWLGDTGGKSTLHYDPLDGTLMQLIGEKQITLFPPDQMYNLYPLPLLNHIRYGKRSRCNHSLIDLDQPDTTRYPRLEIARRSQINVTLKEGEILFIPAGWWHEVVRCGNTPVCSINRWWWVTPASRSLRSWSQWRVHLGTILSIPHLAFEALSAVFSKHPRQKLKQLWQKL